MAELQTIYYSYCFIGGYAFWLRYEKQTRTGSLRGYNLVLSSHWKVDLERETITKVRQKKGEQDL